MTATSLRTGRAAPLAAAAGAGGADVPAAADPSADGGVLLLLARLRPHRGDERPAHRAERSASRRKPREHFMRSILRFNYPHFPRFFPISSRFPLDFWPCSLDSWRPDAENGRKMGENG